MMAKAMARRKETVEEMRRDRREILADADAAAIVRAMTDVASRDDPEGQQSMDKFWIPRFRLRH
jgi:hypothetical protein